LVLRIDICSDLHVDRNNQKTSLLVQPGTGPTHWPAGQVGNRDAFFAFDFEWYRNPGSSICIIAGDVSDSLNETIDVIEHAAKFYEHVVFVDGNHEHYNADYRLNMILFPDDFHDKLNVLDTMYELRAHFANSPNIHYLDGLTDVSWRHGDTLFIGANCWYDWLAHEPRGIAKQTAFWEWHISSHDRTLDFDEFGLPDALGLVQLTNMHSAFEEANNNPAIKHVVVVTHTAPSQQFTKWEGNQSRWDKLTPSYVNTGAQSIINANTKDKLKLWAFGHTHNRVRVDYDGTIYVNNGYGIPHNSLGTFQMETVEIK